MNWVKRSIITTAIVLASTLLVALASPRTAEAQTANLSVQVILASNSGSGMDGSLRGIASQLSSRFSGFSDFRLLASHGMSLSSGRSQSLGLPNGQTMTIAFQGMSGSSYRLQVSLPGGGTTVTAAPGGIFFVAGPTYQSGIIIVAITP